MDRQQINEKVLVNLKLTKTQRKVASLIMLGLPTELIAKKIDRQEKSVKAQLTNIYRMTDTDSRASFIIKVACEGWQFKDAIKADPNILSIGYREVSK